jgi:hypothetical protein
VATNSTENRMLSDYAKDVTAKIIDIVYERFPELEKIDDPTFMGLHKDLEKYIRSETHVVEG